MIQDAVSHHANPPMQVANRSSRRSECIGGFPDRRGFTRRRNNSSFPPSLDHYALGITALELLFNLCERRESRSEEADREVVKLLEDCEECPRNAGLAEAILELRHAWRCYWRYAKEIWAQLFATFKGTSTKDWSQLKRQFCQQNVSRHAELNVLALKAGLKKAAARAEGEWR